MRPLTLSFRGLLFILLLANLQCKKSHPPPNILPPMTQDGKNTFGCMVNGEVWIPYSQCGLINFLTHCEELQSVVTPFDTTSKLPLEVDLFASRKIGQGSFTSFIIRTRILKTGKFDSSFIVIYTRDSISYYLQYPISHVSNAITVTKLDTVNKIVSGTFYFTLYNSSYGFTSDSLVVTDGRFDVTYNACLCH
ncbi:MAG TPA: hypothetical protein VGZ90_07610 [Puia sp.]|jgi:hypothetical protein|nr:hypothetical protein [Puia sp.]